jgi:hypothetical protein
LDSRVCIGLRQALKVKDFLVHSKLTHALNGLLAGAEIGRRLG